MSSYIIRRLLLIIPSLVLVTLIAFIIVRLIPGSIIDMMVAEIGEGATHLDRPAIEHALGLDVPIHIQYGRRVLE